MKKPTPTATPTYTLLSTIEGGITTAPVLVKFLGKHKSTIYETIKKAEKQGLLLKIGKSPAVLELTGMGKIYCMRIEKNIGLIHKVGKTSLVVNNKKIRMHRTSIKFKLVDDSKDCVKWDRIRHMNGWDKKFKFFKNEAIGGRLVKFTIEKTSISVILYCNVAVPRNKDANKVLMDFKLRLIFFCDHWLRKRGVIFDVYSGETIHQHLASEEDVNERVDTSNEVEIQLGREASSFFETRMTAKAWLDWSKKRDRSVMDIESNDLTYNEKIVMSPEYIEQIRREQRTVGDIFAEMAVNIDAYNVNIKLHTKTQNAQLITLEKINKAIERLGK